MKPVPPPRRPLLSQASRPLTVTIPAVNEAGETVPTAIAGEYPLTLYVDRREIVTLMTLGAAPEALAIGWLRNQRLVDSLFIADATFDSLKTEFEPLEPDEPFELVDTE